MFLFTCLLRLIGYQRMVATLAQCESTMLKSRLTTSMYKAEMKNYESLCEEIGNGIKFLRFSNII